MSLVEPLPGGRHKFALTANTYTEFTAEEIRDVRELVPHGHPAETELAALLQAAHPEE
jgi:hypothetical protein